MMLSLPEFPMYHALHSHGELGELIEFARKIQLQYELNSSHIPNVQHFVE